jgi:hypothetical protein
VATTPRVFLSDGCKACGAHYPGKTQRPSSSAIRQAWSSGSSLSSSSATVHRNFMPDATSDVKGQVEEDGDEPGREIQNGKKYLLQPTSSAGNPTNWTRGLVNQGIVQGVIRPQGRKGVGSRTKMRTIHVSYIVRWEGRIEYQDILELLCVANSTRKCVGVKRSYRARIAQHEPLRD